MITAKNAHTRINTGKSLFKCIRHEFTGGGQSCFHGEQDQLPNLTHCWKYQKLGEQRVGTTRRITCGIYARSPRLFCKSRNIHSMATIEYQRPLRRAIDVVLHWNLLRNEQSLTRFFQFHCSRTSHSPGVWSDICQGKHNHHPSQMPRDWLSHSGSRVDKSWRTLVSSGGSWRWKVEALLNVTKQDEGEYECTAKNTVDSERSKTKLEVIQVLVQPTEVLVVYKGNHTSVRWQATGETRPHMKWSTSGGDLPDGRALVLADGTLKLTNVQWEDAGEYVCTASVKTSEFTVGKMQLIVTDGKPMIHDSLHRSFL